MKSLEIPQSVLEEIRRHGAETYPEECCGFLLAASPEAGEGPRRVTGVQRSRNDSEGERHHRFVIPAEDLRAAERSLEKEGQLVVGFYHSHPDHPARPSAFDERNAWPWYSYVVLAVDRGRPGELGGFELDPDPLTFREVDLKILPSPEW